MSSWVNILFGAEVASLLHEQVERSTTSIDLLVAFDCLASLFKIVTFQVRHLLLDSTPTALSAHQACRKEATASLVKVAQKIMRVDPLATSLVDGPALDRVLDKFRPSFQVMVRSPSFKRKAESSHRPSAPPAKCLKPQAEGSAHRGVGQSSCPSAQPPSSAGWDLGSSCSSMARDQGSSYPSSSAASPLQAYSSSSSLRNRGGSKPSSPYGWPLHHPVTQINWAFCQDGGTQGLLSGQSSIGTFGGPGSGVVSHPSGLHAWHKGSSL